MRHESITEISAWQSLGNLENCFDMIDLRLTGHQLRTACYTGQLLAATGMDDEKLQDLDCLVLMI